MADVCQPMKPNGIFNVTDISNDFYVFSIDNFFFRCHLRQKKNLPGFVFSFLSTQTFSNNMNKSLKANYWQLFSCFSHVIILHSKKTKKKHFLTTPDGRNAPRT